MSMLCAGHLYIVWICWRISALYIHIYVRDVSERELPIQLLLLLGRETCSLDYNMYSSIYICSSTISSNGHFIDPPPTPLDIVYFFLLFLLHRQPAATGLYIQTPQKKNRSASIFPAAVHTVHMTKKILMDYSVVAVDIPYFI